jgi:DNA-binding MarR family transcriptional regulator
VFQCDAWAATKLKHAVVQIDVKQINRPAASLAVRTARGHNPSDDVAQRAGWFLELPNDLIADAHALFSLKSVILTIDNIGVNSPVSAMMERKAMATMPKRKGTSPVASSKGEAIADLMLEVAQFFFRIRAIGQKTGFITSWGAGAFGFMHSLALTGPLTVPQIARMRPTSRQRMQRLADELAADGLVEFIDNPRHRRSKLVRLTRKGHARYRELSARLLEMASTMGADLSEADIRKTAETVRRLSDEARDARG